MAVKIMIRAQKRSWHVAKGKEGSGVNVGLNQPPSAEENQGEDEEKPGDSQTQAPDQAQDTTDGEAEKKRKKPRPLERLRSAKNRAKDGKRSNRSKARNSRANRARLV